MQEPCSTPFDHGPGIRQSREHLGERVREFFAQPRKKASAPLALLAFAVYAPWLQAPIGTYALGVGHWMTALGAATVLPVLDVTKRWIGGEVTTLEPLSRDG